jgi:hypothetical protein
MLDPVTRDKVHIVRGSGNILRALREHIADDQIPSDYGGSGCALGASEEEKKLFAHVEAVLHPSRDIQPPSAVSVSTLGEGDLSESSAR